MLRSPLLQTVVILLVMLSMAVILKIKMAADTLVIFMDTRLNMNLHTLNYMCV